MSIVSRPVLFRMNEPVVQGFRKRTNRCDGRFELVADIRDILPARLLQTLRFRNVLHEHDRAGQRFYRCLRKMQRDWRFAPRHGMAGIFKLLRHALVRKQRFSVGSEQRLRRRIHERDLYERMVERDHAFAEPRQYGRKAIPRKRQIFDRRGKLRRKKVQRFSELTDLAPRLLVRPRGKVPRGHGDRILRHLADRLHKGSAAEVAENDQTGRRARTAHQQRQRE